MSLLSLFLTFTITLFVLFGPMYSSGADFRKQCLSNLGSGEWIF